ncbi:MAG: spoIIIJ-associated RNA-binding protein [Dehalococcoidia bacterium]|nr:spoIIIJ-associated RNA-binding protein [Dehalococcoidia bacterium]
METLEISGKTVREAVKKALKQLGLTEEQVEVTVLKKGRPGLLGLGVEEAVVRVERLAPVVAPGVEEVGDVALEVVGELVSLMGISARVEAGESQGEGEEESGKLLVDIKGDDLGLLIGRRGQTLASLQYIARLIVSKRLGARQSLTVDIEGYKERRYRSLQALALRMAEQVKATGRTVALEPMPADERRVIHLALADDVRVTSESSGEGEDRYIAISVRS